MCITCNNGLNSPNGTNGTNCSNRNSGSSGTDNSIGCSSYCNSSCNSKCESNQSYCSIGYQLITKHGDVGAYPGEIINTNDIIAYKWSFDFWNNLVDKIETAEIVGKKKSQGVGEVINPKPKKDAPITAKIYNQVEHKLERFNTSYAEVQQEQIISAAVANAMKTAYEAATFNASVCDVCNASGSQSKKTCSCNCPSCSSCPSCSCSCSCSCNCSRCSSCSCNCSSCASPSSNKD